MKDSLNAWLASMANRQGGDILAVQTIRNAIMAASVLASAAMVAMMGVLATAHLHPRLFAGVTAALLAASAAAALRAIILLARAGFELQLDEAFKAQLANSLRHALHLTSWSAMLLVLALLIAGLPLVV